MAKTIYDCLKEDHDELKSLMEALTKTEGDSDERKQLFQKFSTLLDTHSHAEERTFYAAILSDERTRSKTAHGCKEHCEAADLLEELKNTDRSSSGWLLTMKKLREEVEHHIKEEENELFPKAKKVLSNSEATEMGSRFRQVFEDEKAA